MDALDTNTIELIDKLIIVDGNIITSDGLSTGMDFSVGLIEIMMEN
ncbi:MAG: hypothetical protein KAH00_07570 [Cocleimonas sp.]|nr:hypothetical protein [Cocleimonas sp.]